MLCVLACQRRSPRSGPRSSPASSATFASRGSNGRERAWLRWDRHGLLAVLAGAGVHAGVLVLCGLSLRTAYFTNTINFFVFDCSDIVVGCYCMVHGCKKYEFYL